MSEPNAEYDSPWKEALEEEFEDFLAFFFPEVHAGIDWTHPVEFLDKELQQITPDSAVGPRMVDKLVKVRRKDQTDARVLTHVEVQAQAKQGFPKRMYIYSYRGFDCQELPVVSLAVLGDSDPRWRPDHFEYSLWGCTVSLRFPVVKLLDYEAQWGMLEASDSPFAIAVMAHLRTLSTHGDPPSRRAWKARLAKDLYQRGWLKERVRRFFRFIDWMMTLPEEMERGFHDEMLEYGKTMSKPYVTTIERFAKEDGRMEGRHEGAVEATQTTILDVLEIRFDQVPEPIVVAVRAIQDPERLLELHRRAIKVPSLQEFEAELAG